MNPIDAIALSTLLPPSLKNLKIECVEETGSTNSDLLEVLRASPASTPRPILRQAAKQSAGRGRLGRPWINQVQSSLMFSLAWPLQVGLNKLGGLSLACGLALAHALTDDVAPLSAHRLKLKWPNDILLDGQKMGGILIETLSHQANFSWVVIGVGINYLHDVQIEAQLGHKTAALVNLRGDMDWSTLLAHLVTALAQQLKSFEAHGFAPMHDDWQHYDAYLGQNVQIYDGARCLAQGTVMGVDHLGQLQLQTISGIISIAAGEVSLRCNSI